MHNRFIVVTDIDNIDLVLEKYDENEHRSGFEDHTNEVTQAWDNLVQAERSKYYNITDFACKYFGYEKSDGYFGSFYNPDWLYDWYQVGGRWNDTILTKDGKSVTNCKLNEVDNLGVAAGLLIDTYDASFIKYPDFHDITSDELIADINSHLGIDSHGECYVYVLDFHS